MEISSNSFNLQHMPQEILDTILKYLSPTELLVVRSVSKIFEQVAMDPLRWKNFARELDIVILDLDVPYKKVFSAIRLNKIGLNTFPAIEKANDPINQYKKIINYLENYKIDNLTHLSQPEIAELLLNAQSPTMDQHLQNAFSFGWLQILPNIYLYINNKETYSDKAYLMALNIMKGIYEPGIKVVNRLLELNTPPSLSVILMVKAIREYRNDFPNEIVDRLRELYKKNPDYSPEN